MSRGDNPNICLVADVEMSAKPYTEIKPDAKDTLVREHANRR
jgi:hypothetical protein